MRTQWQHENPVADLASRLFRELAARHRQEAPAPELEGANDTPTFVVELSPQGVLRDISTLPMYERSGRLHAEEHKEDKQAERAQEKQQKQEQKEAKRAAHEEEKAERQREKHKDGPRYSKEQLVMDALFDSVEATLREEFDGADEDIASVRDYLREAHQVNELAKELGGVLDVAAGRDTATSAKQKAEALKAASRAFVEAVHDRAREDLQAAHEAEAHEQHEQDDAPSAMQMLSRGLEMTLAGLTRLASEVSGTNDGPTRLSLSQNLSITMEEGPNGTKTQIQQDLDLLVEVGMQLAALPAPPPAPAPLPAPGTTSPAPAPTGDGTFTGAPQLPAPGGTSLPDDLFIPTPTVGTGPVATDAQAQSQFLQNMLSLIEESLRQELGDVTGELGELGNFFRTTFTPSDALGGGGGMGTGGPTAPEAGFVARSEEVMAEAQVQAKEHFAEQPKTAAQHVRMQQVIDRSFSLMFERLRSMAERLRQGDMSVASDIMQMLQPSFDSQTFLANQQTVQPAVVDPAATTQVAA